MIAPETEDKPVICSHCGEPLSLSLVAKCTASSRMSFCMTPKQGEKMSAAVVGGIIEQLAKLLGAVGEEVGWETLTLIDSIATLEDGTIQVDLLLTRPERRA